MLLLSQFKSQPVISSLKSQRNNDGERDSNPLFSERTGTIYVITVTLLGTRQMHNVRNNLIELSGVVT